MSEDRWKTYVCGSDSYKIEYRFNTGKGWWEVYAVDKPTNRFNTNINDSHICPKTGLICVAKGREPRDFEKAEAIAYLWMQGFSVYVKTGSFPATGGRVNVID